MLQLIDRTCSMRLTWPPCTFSYRVKSHPERESKRSRSIKSHFISLMVSYRSRTPCFQCAARHHTQPPTSLLHRLHLDAWPLEHVIDAILLRAGFILLAFQIIIVFVLVLKAGL